MANVARAGTAGQLKVRRDSIVWLNGEPAPSGSQIQFAVKCMGDPQKGQEPGFRLDLIFFIYHDDCLAHILLLVLLFYNTTKAIDPCLHQLHTTWTFLIPTWLPLIRRPRAAMFSPR
jgi:hypothetical protein